MTTEEKTIMADLYYFLRDHSDPPPVGTEACVAFWEKAAREIGALVGGKWKNHPLAMEMGIGVCGYLERKCRVNGEKAGERKGEKKG